MRVLMIQNHPGGPAGLFGQWLCEARGNAVGVQFHPEASAAMANDWATKTPDMLARAGADPATIARDGAIHGTSDAARHALFTEMLRRAGVAPKGGLP